MAIEFKISPDLLIDSPYRSINIRGSNKAGEKQREREANHFYYPRILKQRNKFFPSQNRLDDTERLEKIK